MSGISVTVATVTITAGLQNAATFPKFLHILGVGTH